MTAIDSEPVTGPGRYRTRLPAAPLVAAIDRILARAVPGIDHSSNGVGTEARTYVYECLGVNPRVLYTWRNKPGARVSRECADRVLSASPYLWFDVWLPCPDHARARTGCGACTDYYRARYLFTGAPIPLALGRCRKAVAA